MKNLSYTLSILSLFLSLSGFTQTNSYLGDWGGTNRQCWRLSNLRTSDELRRDLAMLPRRQVILFCNVGFMSEHVLALYSLACFNNLTILELGNAPVPLRDGSLRNCLGNEGAQALGLVLLDLPLLISLGLRGNEIGPDGAKDLAPGLATLKRLQDFSIWDNPIGDLGLSYILPALGGSVVKVFAQNTELSREAQRGLLFCIRGSII